MSCNKITHEESQALESKAQQSSPADELRELVAEILWNTQIISDFVPWAKAHEDYKQSCFEGADAAISLVVERCAGINVAAAEKLVDLAAATHSPTRQETYQLAADELSSAILEIRSLLPKQGGGR